MTQSLAGIEPVVGRGDAIGAALMGKKRGDKVEVSTPKGVNNFEIIDFK